MTTAQHHDADADAEAETPVPKKKGGARMWAASSTIFALVVAGVAIYDRVEAERNYNQAMATLQQQIDDANAEWEEYQREQEEYQREQEDIAEATDDIDVRVADQLSHPDGYGNTEVYTIVENTSNRTVSFFIEMAIIDPQNPSDIYDTTTLSTGTLAPGETTRLTAFFTSDSRDWPKTSGGSWSWKVASATGYAA